MKSAVWDKELRFSADPQRGKHYLELFAESNPGAGLGKFPKEKARILCALFCGSNSLSELLIANPAWLEILTPEGLRYSRRKQGLGLEVDSVIGPLLASRDYNSALQKLRQFKQREMLRIGVRDLARFGRLPDIVRELSDVADVVLANVWNICHLQLAGRLGTPHHRDQRGKWHPTDSCVLGLGKLGGEELNYSSDVDVVFVYSEEGSVMKEGSQVATATTNHQFFNRLAEAFVTEVQRMTPQGSFYRVDLRLRPEGEIGPLSRSLAGYENYYSQWGQTWERMMLIKARGVAGSELLAAEFLEMIQAFRYPRSINSGVLREVATIKDRIESEVVKIGELERNVKLGRGGIREIEFIVQSAQLLHAGKQPFLQGSQTLPGLEKLAQYELLSLEDANSLAAAYCFLRDVEHRLQMEDNLQTHTIPEEAKSRKRLAKLMAFPDTGAFEKSHHQQRQLVRGIFEKLLKAEKDRNIETSTSFPRRFENAEAEWKKRLADHGFKDLDRAFRVLREFVEGPGFIHVSPRTRELAFELLPRLFDMCRDGKPGPHSSATQSKHSTPDLGLSDPDRVVTRFDGFISAYGARATLFELWNRNPAIFDLLALLFDRSEFLAELAIRTPDLVDELVTSGRLQQRKTAEETFRDLRHGLGDENQSLWLRRYHEAEFMRIGLRDILGLSDFEQYLTELSALADAVLRYSLEVVMRKFKLKQPPFGVIGLGKLGGAEIDYGSDLDLMFVTEARSGSFEKLAKQAVELMELISTRTEQGIVFQTDARLRPDGEKGLLVNSLDAYDDYYRRRAHLWEIQTLTRSRYIAGDPKTGAAFQKLASRLTYFDKTAEPIAAFSADWISKIHQMRMRIEKERTPAGKDGLAIKTGRGGMMDAEFVAQKLCLQYGWHEANTLRALQRGREAGVLPEAELLIENYRRLRRIEGVLRRWSYEGETVLPDDPAPFRRVSIRCGFPSPESFRDAVSSYRESIRKVYSLVFEK